MTKELYWEYPYKKEFNAKITSIKKDGVVLDQTLFYPKGGGQANDQGILIYENYSFEIKDVTKDGDEIEHHISSDFQDKLKIGDNIIGKIDWNYRYGLMKSHTSQHLFSAVLKKKFNVNTAYAYIDFEDVILHIDKEISYDQLKSAFQELIELCTLKSYKISSRIIPFKEVQKSSDKLRGEIPKHDKIRLVETSDFDLVCCGGTHVKDSTEIGILFIYSFTKGREIKYFVGNKALNLLAGVNTDLLDISNIIKKPILNIKETIKKNFELISEIKESNKYLTIRTLELASKNPNMKINDISVYLIELDLDFKIVNYEFKNFPSNSLLIVKKEAQIKILSNIIDINANEILQILIKKYDGKGGGTPKSAQGALENEPKDILSDLKLILTKN